MRFLPAFLAALVCLIAAPAASAATLHVSPNGSGSSCTSLAPCGSFAAAHAAAAPGDVVEVAAGTYSGQNLTRNVSAGPAVTFREALGARVILGGLSVQGADWLTFNGFEMTYQDSKHQESVWAGPGSTNIRFENLDA